MQPAATPWDRLDDYKFQDEAEAVRALLTRTPLDDAERREVEGQPLPDKATVRR